MMNKLLLAGAALGAGAVMLLAKSNQRSGSTSVVTITPKDPPPYTLNPKGRMLTDFEKSVLTGWIASHKATEITPQALDTAKLWFERPKSSFTQEGDAEQGLTTEALTTKDGIFFPTPNREFDDPESFALLAHELVHWNQWVTGTHSANSAANEVPAYQTQISVKEYLDQNLDAIKDAWSKGHPGWS